MNNGSSEYRNNEDDYQIIVNGFLRHAAKSDVIDFSLYFLRFEIRFTVTIPEEGTTRAPVYIKCRLSKDRP
jgi:hypothetical protein